ncbi:hypothetical protein HWV62_30195 [Athelia sp. TMB]|nr:hypothetical protein HWV62_30195 [Athelia sp. TMB]
MSLRPTRLQQACTAPTMSQIANTLHSSRLTGNMHRGRTILAQELVDMIIDFLHADRAALAACSLTCHAWLPAAHLHLFYSVDASVRTLQTLCERLERWPQLAARVQCLSVGDRKSSDKEMPAAAEMVAEVRRLATLLPSVTHMKISGRFLRWSADTAWNVLRALSCELSHVARLDLAHVAFFAFYHFAEFLSGFTALRRVTLLEVGWALELNLGGDTALRLAHPLAVALCVKSGPRQAHCCVEWIARQRPAPELHGFLLHVEYEGGLLTRTLLQSPLAASIRTLYLRCDTFAEGANELVRGIGHCTSLRELRFASPLSPENFKTHQAIITSIISSIKSEHLAFITFALTCEHPETVLLDADTLRALGTMLSTPALGRCRAQVIMLTNEDLGDFPDPEPLREQWAALGAPLPLSFRPQNALRYGATRGIPWTALASCQ